MNINNILYLNSELYDNYQTFNDKFGHLADILLNHTILKINDKDFRICEIEFYFKSDYTCNNNNKHLDIFTHCDEDQSIPYRWYFHKQNGKSYKGGTYKGLDLTFGYDNNKPNKPKKKTYGGVLIRSVLDIENNKLIEGPCKIVNKILETSGSSINSIDDFVTDQTKKGFCDEISGTLLATVCKRLHI